MRGHFLSDLFAVHLAENSPISNRAISGFIFQGVGVIIDGSELDQQAACEQAACKHQS